MPGKPSDIKNADVDELVAALSTEEAISLTLGVGNWFTAAVPRLEIPAINVRPSAPSDVLQEADGRGPRSPMGPMVPAVGSIL